MFLVTYSVHKYSHTIWFSFPTVISKKMHLDRNLPLNVYSRKNIKKTEFPQRSIMKRIDGMSALDYWVRLEKFTFYSLQHRCEHNIICMMWKLFHHCLNAVGIFFKIHNGLGPLANCLNIDLTSNKNNTAQLYYMKKPCHIQYYSKT